MSTFNIGDRVKVIVLSGDDKTGTILGKGNTPDGVLREVRPGYENHEPVMKAAWWKVRIDCTGEIEEVPDDLLEYLSVPPNEA